MGSEFEFVLMRGLSMWPTLREGELLKGRWRPVNEVSPGTISGYWSANRRLIIHRFLGLIMSPERNVVLMRTAGDFSGCDRLHEAPAHLMVVEKVLRGGRWISPGNSLIYSVISILLARISCFRNESGIILPYELVKFLGRWWKALEQISR